MNRQSAPQPLNIERLTVRADRVVCAVRIREGYLRTNERLVQAVLQTYPNLAYHACVNNKGTVFGSVIEDTPVPHLLEHLVIQLQVEAAEDDHATYVGTTEWIDREQGTACVQVSFDNDMTALAAFRDAAAFLNPLLMSCTE